MGIETLPSNEHAERTILGAILMENEAIFTAYDKLRELDFSLDSHRRIYRAMMDIDTDGGSIDIVTLSSELGRRKEIESIGGISYLASLTEGLPRRMVIDEYCDIVAEKSRLRSIIDVCTNGASVASYQVEESFSISGDVAAKLSAIDDRANVDDSLEAASVREMQKIEEERDGGKSRDYASTIRRLDVSTGGIRSGEVTILAARPEQGKTWMMLQMISHHCDRGTPCHMFSLEMPKGEILRRIWSQHSGVTYGKLRHPERMLKDDIDRVRESMLTVSGWPLVIDDDAMISPSQMMARVRSIKRRNKTEIVAVDYLQKFMFGDPNKRAQAISDAMVSIARIAKIEDVAVLLISSLTENEKGINSVPTLRDLRWSGDTKYEAHQVWFIHREVPIETMRPEPNGIIIQGKARADIGGNVSVTFNPERLRFEDV